MTHTTLLALLFMITGFAGCVPVQGRAVYDYHVYGGPNVFRDDYPDIGNEDSATRPPIISIKLALSGYLMKSIQDETIVAHSTFIGDEMLWEVYSVYETQHIYYFKNIQDGCYLSHKVGTNSIICEPCNNEGNNVDDLPCDSPSTQLQWFLKGGYQTNFDPQSANVISKAHMVFENRESGECIKPQDPFEYSIRDVVAADCNVPLNIQLIEIEAFGRR